MKLVQEFISKEVNITKKITFLKLRNKSNLIISFTTQCTLLKPQQQNNKKINFI